MNRFNRFMTVIFLILLLFAFTITLIVPDLARLLVEWATGIVAGALGGPEATFVQAMQGVNLILRLAVVLVVDLVLIIVLYYELRRRSKHKVVIRVRGTEAEISPESIESQLHKSVDALDNLLDVSINVEPARAGKVKVKMDVLATPEVLVAQKVKEINKVVREVAGKNLGLKLAGAPVIHVELASPSAVAHRDEVMSGPDMLEAPEPVPALIEPKLPEIFEPAPDDQFAAPEPEPEPEPAWEPEPEPEAEPEPISLGAPTPEIFAAPPPAETEAESVEAPEAAALPSFEEPEVVDDEPEWLRPPSEDDFDTPAIAEPVEKPTPDSEWAAQPDETVTEDSFETPPDEAAFAPYEYEAHETTPSAELETAPGNGEMAEESPEDDDGDAVNVNGEDGDEKKKGGWWRLGR